MSDEETSGLGHLVELMALAGVIAGIAALAVVSVVVSYEDVRAAAYPVIVPEKAAYAPGEDVVFRIINAGDEVFWFGDGGFGVKVRAAGGGAVFSHAGDGARTGLEPGEERVLSWDQADDLGRQVAPGDYEIYSEYYERVSAPVTIG